MALFVDKIISVNCLGVGFQQFNDEKLSINFLFIFVL